MTVRELLPQLKGAKRCGKEWTARCPAHSDSKPSLSVREAGGRVLLHCHAGCSTEDIVRALGMKMSDLFNESSGQPREVVSYPYKDESGQLLFEVVRYEPKGFKQRRPDGQGGWIWRLNGTCRVLYNLPAVLCADLVLICEGEKDCNRAGELGFVATCNPGGAGKWRDEHSECLRGKCVVIVPDRDEPGRKHAQNVFRSLVGIAASVEIVELPSGKDLSEWADAAGASAREQLLKIIDETRQPTTAEPQPCANTGQIVANVEQYVRRFCILPDAAYLPVAVWIVATHSAHVFDCFPYLALLSPAKRCGKTRLLEVLEQLAFHPWRGIAPTPASIFRMMAEQPTLLLDEVEVLNTRNKSESTQAILSIMNAGHRKGATIPRCDGPKNELKHFPVYGPKAFAAIGRLPDTLTDRSIKVTMQRRTAGQLVERFLLSRATADAKPLRESITNFAKANQGNIRRAYERLMSSDLAFLGDRDADLWLPLFAICSTAAPERTSELEKCAQQLCSTKAGDDENDSLPLKLLADIQAVWPAERERCDTKTLIERLRALEESAWEECGLSPRKLARMLRPFEIEARVMRVTDTVRGRGYEYRDLLSAFNRYIDSTGVTSVTNQQ